MSSGETETVFQTTSARTPPPPDTRDEQRGLASDTAAAFLGGAVGGAGGRFADGAIDAAKQALGKLTGSGASPESSTSTERPADE